MTVLSRGICSSNGRIEGPSPIKRRVVWATSLFRGLMATRGTPPERMGAGVSSSEASGGADGCRVREVRSFS